MSRPTSTRTRTRVQVQAPANTPSLDVVAPMQVDTAPSGSAVGWGQLQQALGLAAPIVKQAVAQKDAHAEQQGVADERLGVADKERMQREEKYADGVEHAFLVRETSAAITQIEEEAASLPTTMSVDDKMKWVDDRLKAELGPLSGDPKARRVIHEQVADYLTKFAGREVSATREQHKATAVEAAEIEINRALEGADVDIPSLVNTVSSVFPGGRTEAWGTVVEMVAQKAERDVNPDILKLLPARVVTEDGQSIDSPILSKTNKARIEQARARIAQAQEEKLKPIAEYEKGKAKDYFLQRIDAGDLISYEEGKPYIEAGLLSGDEFASLADASRAEVERRAAEAAKERDLFGAFQMAGGDSWIDTEGLPNGAANRKESQELTDASVQRYLVGAAGGDATQARLTGEQLASDLAALRSVLGLTKRLRLPYTPLKGYLDEINPAMGMTVLKRLDAYREVKAAGQSTAYVDADTEAVFELALSAQRAGEKPETIVQSLQRMSDPAFKANVAENRTAVHKAIERGELDVLDRWRDEDIRKVSNWPLVRARVRDLADIYLSRGLVAKEAVQLAQRRFADTHFAVRLNDKTIVVPQVKGPDGDLMDNDEVRVALEAISAAAPKVAQKAGEDPAGAYTVVRFGVNGRDLEVAVVDATGADIPGGRFSISKTVSQLRTRTTGPKLSELVRISREAQAPRKRAQQRLMDRAYNRDISIQPKL